MTQLQLHCSWVVEVCCVELAICAVVATISIITIIATITNEVKVQRDWRLTLDEVSDIQCGSAGQTLQANEHKVQ